MVNLPFTKAADTGYYRVSCIKCWFTVLPSFLLEFP